MVLTPEVSHIVIEGESQMYVFISHKYQFLCIDFLSSGSFSYGILRIGYLQ